MTRLEGPAGAAGPARWPGKAPRVWNLPTRNPQFTGREALLVEVRQRFLDEDRSAVQAFAGMGGVGKTQLAIEYAYRFSSAYEFAWWINAAQPGMIGYQFAALGAALECIGQGGGGTEAMRAIVLAELRDRGRWLLVFDGVADPADVTDWLPGGSGHVLITSRKRDWTEIAVPVEVEVLTRPESVKMLRDRVSELSDADADLLAGELGDLPLALAQAARYMPRTGMPAEEYLRMLKERAGQILDQDRPPSYPLSLAAATQLSFDRLAEDDLAASQLALLCAFLAPGPIPEELFTKAVGALPAELAARASDPLAWREILASLQSLARIDQRAIQMHRATQVILRARLSVDQKADTSARVEELLVASDPGDPVGPANWPSWARLMPHLLAVDLAATDSAELRRLACRGCEYLLARGDARTVRDLAGGLRPHWQRRLGGDDPDTLMITHHLARSLRELGEGLEARDLDADTLARRRRVLGDDHRVTLTSANSLAADLGVLGDLLKARELNEDTLRRRRRTLGDDDPDTLTSASNLAADLSDLGEEEEARDLYRDTLNRCRRVLIKDHPYTLMTAMNLAITLTKLDEVEAARPLAEDAVRGLRRIQGENRPNALAEISHLLMSISNLAEILREIKSELPTAREHAENATEGLRRVLGANHHYTLSAASNLAEILRRMGELPKARTIAEDTLARQREVLGENDQRTLETVGIVAAIRFDMDSR